MYVSTHIYGIVKSHTYPCPYNIYIYMKPARGPQTTFFGKSRLLSSICSHPGYWQLSLGT